MNPKKWKSLQKLSYLFYGLIYVHISCLFGYQILNGRYNYCIELLIYTVIFGVYLFKRIGLYLANTTFKPVSKIFVNTGYFIVASLAIALFSLQYILNNNNHPIVSSEISIDVASKQFDDGEYYGEDMGYNGPISLKLTVSNGKIVDLKFIDYVDEDEYFLPAWESIREQVLTDNDISSLDAVSGATYSSNGIINAINQALYQ